MFELGLHFCHEWFTKEWVTSVLDVGFGSVSHIGLLRLHRPQRWSELSCCCQGFYPDSLVVLPVAYLLCKIGIITFLKQSVLAESGSCLL